MLCLWIYWYVNFKFNFVNGIIHLPFWSCSFLGDENLNIVRQQYRAWTDFEAGKSG